MSDEGILGEQGEDERRALRGGLEGPAAIGPLG
jgi:hypothetical protein